VRIRVIGVVIFLSLSTACEAGSRPGIYGGGEGAKWNCNQCDQIYSREKWACPSMSTDGEVADCFERAATDARMCWRNCNYR
jgi:hypothetical protein